MERVKINKVDIKTLKSFGRLEIVELDYKKLVYLRDFHLPMVKICPLNRAKHEGKIEGEVLTKKEFEFLLHQ